MAKKLAQIDLKETNTASGFVGLGAKAGRIFQKVGTVETLLTLEGHTHKWTQITDKPETFAPTSHTHPATEITDTLTKVMMTMSERNKLSLLSNYTLTKDKIEAVLTGNITTHTHSIAQITGLQGALNSKATPSDISTAIDELEIGGRNLILNSNDASKLGSSKGVVISQGHPDPFGTNNAILLSLQETAYDFARPVSGLIEGEMYTISIYAKLGTATNFVVSPTDGMSWNAFGGGQVVSESKEWEQVSITVKANSRKAIYIHIGGNNGIVAQSIGSVYIFGMKIEKGTKVTDWNDGTGSILEMPYQGSDWSETNSNSFNYIKNKPTQLSQFTDNIGVENHIANKANPHNVTTAQIGAVNLTTNQTIGGAKTFTSPTTIGNIIVGNLYGNQIDRLNGILYLQQASTNHLALVNGGGNVGIGNINPAYKLDVSGDVRATGTFRGSLTGNASSASKLQTAITIAGVSFDGSKNIAIPFANLASKPTTLSGYGITDFTSHKNSNPINVSNIEVNAIGYANDISLFGQVDGGLLNMAYSSAWQSQIFQDFRTGQIALRGKRSGTWTSWRTVWDSGNLTPVTTNTTQTIAGGKTFSKLITANAGISTTAITASGIITVGSQGNSNQWDTAYGWGNHADKNYLTSYVDTKYKAGTGLELLTSGGTNTFNVKLSDSISTTSSTTAATSSAVRLAYNRGSTGITNAATAQSKADSAYTLASGKEDKFTKNGAFNKSFGTAKGTVAQGNDSRINNGQTAFGWGNHALKGYATETYVDSIEIGGRNLITGSTFENGIAGTDWQLSGTLVGGQVDPFGTNKACLVTVTQPNSYLLKTTPVFKSTGEHTISVWMKGTKAGTINIQMQDRTHKKTCTLTTAWQKYEFTANITSVGGEYRFVFGGWSSWTDLALGVYFAFPKLEKGNKATDWNDGTNIIELPEYVQAEIDSKVATSTYTSKMTQLDNEISQRVNKSLTLTAGNGLTGGGTLGANRTFTLGTPTTLSNATTNKVTDTSHTHAITTTTVGAINTIVATDANGGVRGNIIRIGGNWTLELSGSELVFKYNNVIKQRMLSDGSIVSTNEVSAHQ